jgi:hypothetical protein
VYAEGSAISLVLSFSNQSNPQYREQYLQEFVVICLRYGFCRVDHEAESLKIDETNAEAADGAIDL